MYIEEPSLEILLFKYLKTQVSGCVLHVRLNLIITKRLTNIALVLWLVPMGTISSRVLEFYSSRKKLKPAMKSVILMGQDVA